VHYEVDVNGELKRITVTRDGDRFVVILGEHTWTVDAVQVGSHTLSLLLENGNTSPNASGAAASSDLNRRGQVLSRELSLARDPLTGQFVVSVGTIPVSVGVNSRRRFGHRDDGGREGTGPQRIVAPMPGKVVRILGNPGDVVSQRQPVVVIEAMKMENELRASRDGTIAEILVREGQSVEAGTLLAVISHS
jgi:biotin carboxyl carrier protein